MDLHYGYFTEVSAFQLDDSLQSEIQLMPLGHWEHPLYGELDFTPERIQRFSDNFHKRVRGTAELDIDYEHKAKDGKAAGWVKDVKVKADGLWGLVQWTNSAAHALKEGEYRYFSPEFVDEWEDAHGQTHKDVLFGGGITNRPFLRDILPINLSELVTEGGNHDMDPKLIRQRLGLAEDATDEQVQEALEALPEGVRPLVEAAPVAEPPTSETDPPEVEQVPPKVPATLSEPPATLVKLAETDPAVAAILEERKQTADRLSKLEQAHKLSETVARVAQLDEGCRRTFSPHQREKVKTIMLSCNESAAMALSELMTDIAKNGLVELGERRPSDPESITLDDIDAFVKSVTKLQEANPDLSSADALMQAAEQDPDAYERYRKAQLQNAEEVS